jgi:RNA polymerase sigma-70 factor (ECF subfamily)
VALSELDRSLLDRCLAHGPRAWEDFVDRFTGLIFHVVNHTAQNRSILLSAADRDDLAAEVMLVIVKDNFAVLRRFRGDSSLATYLTVIARRVVVRKLVDGRSATPLGAVAEGAASNERVGPIEGVASSTPDVEERISNEEEVERLLGQLESSEAMVVRMYHLEGKSYKEISLITGMAAGSVGPILSRARNKLSEMPHLA